MPNFYIVRLGKDSEKEIRALDAEHGKLEAPLSLVVACSQVPQPFSAGDFVFIWLGSNNNQGTDTDWVKGLRAFGRLTARTGAAGYNESQTLTIDVPLAFPKSVTHHDFLAHAPIAYYWISNVPVLGLNTHSNQTVQAIKSSDPQQNVRALLYALEIINPGFREDISSTYPELLPLFSYTPDDPTLETSSVESQTSEEEVAVDAVAIPDTLPAHWIVSLASKGFILISGPSGTGKSKNARDIARSFDYPLSYAYMASHRAARPSNSLAFVSVGSDWTDGTPLLGFRNMFGAPQEKIDASGKIHLTNERWDPPSALRLILRAINKPDHPHFLVLDEMNLSHVERYFSDILSVLEANRGLTSTDKVKLLDAETVRLVAETLGHSDEYPLEKQVAMTLASQGGGLTFPDNLFIVGTVNVDETTYMFSPKVLDRAHVIEMLPPEPLAYLDGETLTDGTLLPSQDCLIMLQRSISRRREGFWEREKPLALIKQVIEAGGTETDAEEVLATIRTLLAGLQRLLTPIGFSFAYRTMNELCSYVAVYLECKRPELFSDDSASGWINALDRAVLQKVLPRLHGNRRLLGGALSAIELFLGGHHCSYANGQEVIAITEEQRLHVTLKQSVQKLKSMSMRLEATGYTTFVS
jgi:hypothetical protein